VIIHTGADKADGGGAEGTYSIWSHASNVDPLHRRLRRAR
jgi:hypothetical protein